MHSHTVQQKSQWQNAWEGYLVAKSLIGKKKTKLGTCLLGGLLLFSLPNSAVINRGFTLDPHQGKTEKAA